MKRTLLLVAGLAGLALAAATCTASPSTPSNAVPQTTGPASTQLVEGCEQDTEGPLVNLVVPDVTFWPPDRQLHRVSLDQCVVSIVDACEGPLRVATAATIMHVTSDELPEGPQGGSAALDMAIASPTIVELRAERDGRSDGRVYTIHFSVSDSRGNTTPAACRAQVPRMPGSQAIDSGVAACMGIGCS